MQLPKLRTTVLVCLLFVAGNNSVVGALESETTAQRMARIKALSAPDKQQLEQKQQRFEALSVADQSRLRQIETEISAAPNSAQLRQTLAGYHRWLKTLNSAQQTQIASAPSDEARVQLIRKMHDEENRKRFREFASEQASRLPQEDIDAVYAWIDNWTKQHQTELIEHLPLWIREQLLKTPDPAAQRKRLMLGFVMGRPNDLGGHPPPEMPVAPKAEDFRELLSKLSKPTRDTLEDLKNEDQQRGLVLAYVKVAIITKGPRAASEEELRKLFLALPVEKRSELQAMSAAGMKRELMMHFYRQSFGDMRGPGGRGGPAGRGGPGGKVGPDGDGGPPPEFGPQGGKRREGEPRGEDGPPRGRPGERGPDERRERPPIAPGGPGGEKEPFEKGPTGNPPSNLK